MGQIRVSGLGKAYKQYPNRWSRLFEWLVPFSPSRHHLHWILREVEFTIEPGEAVGIVGVNGAGKSTLLKMIAGTTQPTCGEIRVAGRVAALLELGMGFHPDFTGRQNVFMAGQLLGMQVEEIQALMPDIEAFAEIGEAIEQPVRTYSSGMQMRLAFSVATARRPDILIVDEALSVGDAYFQHKSFERIRSFRKAGTTLLIVSHDRSAIQSICDSAILLEQGRMAMRGRPEEVMDYYNALLAEREGQTVRQEMLADGQVRTISGTGEAAILDVRMVDQRQRALEVVEVGQAVTLEVEVEVRQDIERLILGFMIKDRLGQPMYGINTHRLDKALTDLKAGERITYRFAFDMRLGKGHYSVALSLSRLDSHLDRNFEWRDYGLVFHVINNRQEDFVGCSCWAPKPISAAPARRLWTPLPRRALHDASVGRMHLCVRASQGQFRYSAGGAQRHPRVAGSRRDGGVHPGGNARRYPVPGPQPGAAGPAATFAAGTPAHPGGASRQLLLAGPAHPGKAPPVPFLAVGPAPSLCSLPPVRLRLPQHSAAPARPHPRQAAACTRARDPARTSGRRPTGLAGLLLARRFLPAGGTPQERGRGHRLGDLRPDSPDPSAILRCRPGQGVQPLVRLDRGHRRRLRRDFRDHSRRSARGDAAAHRPGEGRATLVRLFPPGFGAGPGGGRRLRRARPAAHVQGQGAGIPDGQHHRAAEEPRLPAGCLERAGPRVRRCGCASPDASAGSARRWWNGCGSIRS